MVLSSQLLASVTHAVNAHSHSMALEMTELHGFPFEAFAAASTQAILGSFVEQQALLHVRQVERSTHPRQLSTKVQVCTAGLRAAIRLCRRASNASMPKAAAFRQP